MAVTVVAYHENNKYKVKATILIVGRHWIFLKCKEGISFIFLAWSYEYSSDNIKLNPCQRTVTSQVKNMEYEKQELHCLKAHGQFIYIANILPYCKTALKQLQIKPGLHYLRVVIWVDIIKKHIRLYFKLVQTWQ